MDLRKLLHFQAVIAGGSFKAGAERAHISAPALTKSIQSLEAELGEPLFKRRRGQPILTEAGVLLSLRCQRILEEVEGINRDLGGLEQLKTGLVHLGCGPAVAQILLKPALLQLHSMNPGIQVAITIGHSDQLLGMLDRIELDLVAADIGGVESHPSYFSEALPTEAFCWVCHPRHPLASAGTLSLGDVVRYPLALPRAPRHMLTALQVHHGVDITRALRSPAVQSDDYHLLLELVRTGSHLSAVPISVMERQENRTELVSLQVEDFQLQTRHGLISRRTQPISSAQLAVMEAFRAV